MVVKEEFSRSIAYIERGFGHEELERLVKSIPHNPKQVVINFIQNTPYRCGNGKGFTHGFTTTMLSQFRRAQLPPGWVDMTGNAMDELLHDPMLALPKGKGKLCD